MLIRTQIEELEKQILSPYACCSADTKGRRVPNEPCDIRTEFQRDRDRIVHCKAFRRLKDKTQVFLSPQGDHYRTRLMHTLEVSQIARTIGKALRLNEDLIEAIALGHDLGHTPFGHAGERALAACCPLGFRHNEQSLRVVDVLEKDGRGLNLTAEVRDGILNHQTAGTPSTLEGQVVRLADKFAYIHHDMDDGQRAGIISGSMMASDLRELTGSTPKTILNTFVHDTIRASYGKDRVTMSDTLYDAMLRVRSFMFEELYTNPAAKQEEGKASAMLQELYSFFMEHPEEMHGHFAAMLENGEKRERVVCDYISGMTDQFSVDTYNYYHVPKMWEKY